MSEFGSLSSELSGYLPGISGFLAEDFIRRSYRKIRDARLWSFLITDDAVVCPAQLTAGTYNITQFNNVVTANAVASAAFLTVAPVILPEQFVQIRFQGVAQTSQIYNIASADYTVPTAIVLTLDRVVQEATNAASSYLVYRPYIVPPAPDFVRWLSVVDMVNGWQLRLDRTSWDFDRADPQRQSLGQSYYVGSYKSATTPANESPSPMFELWPGPTQGQGFYVRYRRRGLDFSAPTDIQPDGIPDDLILQAALGFYAYPWACANPGHFPAMKSVNWMNLIIDAKKTYMMMMIDAKRQDDNTMLQSVFNRGHGLRNPQASWPWPVDADFIQHTLLPI